MDSNVVKPYYRVHHNHYHSTLAEILTSRTSISGHSITRIWVHPDFRNRNLATILLNLLTNDADASNEILYFTPYSVTDLAHERTITIEEQVEWLQRHGFKTIRSKSNNGECLMRRLVRNQLASEVTRKIGKHHMGWSMPE